jgi:hypothetical protein
VNIPHWLADIFAAIMLATAAYCAGRLALARRLGRRVEHDTDLVHLLMGVAMAGMLVSELNPLNGTAWEAVFTVTTLWFAARLVLAWRGGEQPRLALRHHVPHLVLSGAMLYMFLAPSAASGGSSSGGGMGMDMGVGGATAVVHYPTLALVLALFLAGFAITVIDRTPLAAPSGGTPQAGGRKPVRAVHPRKRRTPTHSRPHRFPARPRTAAGTRCAACSRPAARTAATSR